MLESMPEPDEDRSYLEGGSLPAAAVREMFIAAESLHGVAPWDVATEDQVFRMDIPALGVEGACVSILGNEAELIGLLIFPSFDAWTAFVEAGEQTPSPGERIDMGTDWMSLTFGPGAELPAPMLKEAMAHAWPVAAADAYPRVDHPDRDGLPLPITEQDLEIVAAAADAIGGFCAKHYEEFAADEVRARVRVIPGREQGRGALHAALRSVPPGRRWPVTRPTCRRPWTRSGTPRWVATTLAPAAAAASTRSAIFPATRSILPRGRT